MKMPIDLPEALLDEATRAADEDRTTVSALIEQGLARVLRERQAVPFHLRDASVGGRGLSPEAAALDCAQLRNRSYGPRGGTDQ